MDETERAVLKTLVYRNIFSYPLTLHQLVTFAISPKKIDPSKFNNSIINLVEQGKIIKKDGLFWLDSEANYNNALEKRGFRSQASKKLVKKARGIAKVLGVNSFIKMVCVTGSVAAMNAGQNDDIDLFIVTSRNRLWTARFFTVLILKLLGVYRQDGNESGKLCPNIFVDEDRLAWNDKNIYTAHEVLLAIPVYDKKDFYFKFLTNNRWVSAYLPNVYFEKIPLGEEIKRVDNFIADYIEKLLMGFQLWYMQKKKTKEITTTKLIHFKRDDHLEFILSDYLQKSKPLGI